MTSKTHSSQPVSILLVTLLALLTALDAMAIDLYLPAMPTIAEALKVSPGEVQQTLAVFLAGLAIGQGIYGPLLDRFGRRSPLLIGVGIFVAGSVIAAISPSIEWLLVARFVQALGAAAGLVAPRAIIDDLYELEDSARMQSILMQVMMVAPIAAPILGGVLLLHWQWSSIFWVMAILGLLGLVWGTKTVPNSQPVEERVSLSIKAIIHGYGGLLLQPRFVLYTIASGLVLGSFFSYISGSSFVFIEHFKLSATQYSQIFAANSVGLVIGGAISNQLIKRGLSTHKIMILGTLGYTLFAGVLLVVVEFSLSSLLSYAALLSLTIACLGLVFGNLVALTMNASTSPAGVTSAMMGMAQYLLSAVIGFIVSLTPTSIVQLPATIAICGAIAILLCTIASNIKSQSSDLRAIEG
ncbi:multidrug effflux MFS transporter [Shewanella algae]|uniref:multidrug effflux MFS transporter n=1 Tax=Shewanella algae TaxID=38313 RepID=UPI0011842F06|nr:multidrug effflux MFS transporter [Shewanella algae]TVL38071.1 Bcr/CflA family drug resistance efflux transporter [Shewanella algae]